MKNQINIEENNEKNQMNFDQFNQANKTILDEHLFEYLDWTTLFNEQVFRKNNSFFFFGWGKIDFYIRIYQMNYVKNYFIIGHRSCVKINHVIVKQNQK